LGGGYTWWVALFFNGSSSESPAERVFRGAVHVTTEATT
jgi:hypothetical protein